MNNLLSLCCLSVMPESQSLSTRVCGVRYPSQQELRKVLGIDSILSPAGEEDKHTLSKKEFVLVHPPCHDMLEEWCGFDRYHEVRDEARSTATYTCPWIALACPCMHRPQPEPQGIKQAAGSKRELTSEIVSQFQRHLRG